MKKMTSLLAALALSLSVLGGLGACNAAQAADQDVVARGQYLARAGDCMACHSAAGKPAYSGGLAIDSGHGIIYSTNITPDKEHGIGNYSEAQFSAAVRHGVRADGTQLYPAMPYPSYAKVSDEDIHALYTYFMQGVKPVASTPPASSMSFPFNIRWGMKLWNVFFANDKPFKEQDGWSAEIKRGAYLAEGLGHCGSCHTPRGFAMNEKASDSSQAQFLSGGDLNGWAVPSLRGMPHWSAQDIVDYLQTGRNKTASVAGEMSLVVEHSTAHLKPEDLQSIAAYLKTLSPVASASSGRVTPQGAEATTKKLTAAKDLSLGERLYLDNCAACHFVNGKGAPGIFPVLDGATVVNADNPSALLHVILAGARTPSTEKAPSILVMPGFAHRLSDKEAAELASFVRQGWSNQAGAVSEKEVKRMREGLAKHGS